MKEQAQLLLDQNENFINEIVEKIKKSDELIERAQDQQAATAELLAELDKANEKVDDAVKRGDQTLKEAQETLQKLSGIILLYQLLLLIINLLHQKEEMNIFLNYNIIFRISC